MKFLMHPSYSSDLTLRLICFGFCRILLME